MIEEIIKAYDDYLAFITESEKGLIMLAHVHGWRCPEEDIKKGIEMRDNIKRLVDKARGGAK